MPIAPRPSPLRRVPSLRAMLRWCGVGVLVVLFLELVVVSGLPPFGHRFTLPVLAIGLPIGLPIILLRRRPVIALALILSAAIAVDVSLNPVDTWYLRQMVFVQFAVVDIVVGFIASRSPRRTSLLSGLVALVAQLLLYFSVGTTPRTVYDARPSFLGADPPVTVIIVLAIVVCWVVGNSVRQRRQYNAARRAQAEVQAVQAERLRIARELHDMIAHSIGVIAIQAGVGSRVIETQPAEARNALTAIEDTSRETLAGLRRMLGALRRSDTDPGSAPMDPTPGLGDLDGLVARSSYAGVHVDVEWCGDRRDLPPDIDLSAFRIIQEAITNVARHAHSPRCRVRVELGDDELAIEVTDDGRGGVPGGTGFGIAGMRERVALLEGELAAGPRPGGGFRVAARLPVVAA